MSGAAGSDARLDVCDDCALSDGAGCCGAGHGGTLLRSDRAVLTLAGPVILLIVLAVLTVPTSRHPVLLALAVPTLLLGVGVSGLGVAALRRVGSAGDRVGALALRLLPVAVGGLLLSLAAGLLLAVVG